VMVKLVMVKLVMVKLGGAIRNQGINPAKGIKD